MAGLSLWMVLGSAAIASAYPAGSESFPTGDTSCASAAGLAPQLRKEPELRAACAPSAPIMDVGEIREPVPSTPNASPVPALLPWLAVALAFATAVSMKSIRARLGSRGYSGPVTGIFSVALIALVVLTAACGNGAPATQQEAAASTSEAPQPSGEKQISRVDFEDPWPFLELVGAGLLVCEDDGSITFTPPAGGDTYAVNRLAQEAGYADIEGISVGPPLDPILERGVELCPADVAADVAEPVS